MNATLLLADAAQSLNNKLYILGGGATAITPDRPTAIAMKIDVPWDQTNIKHRWELKLIDSDGNPVMFTTEGNVKPIEISGTFEMGRPTGHPPGSPVAMVRAIQFSPLPLKAGLRYVWELSINSETKPEWQVIFTVVEKSTK